MPRGLEGDRNEAPAASRFGTLFPERRACEAGPDAIESLVGVMTPLQSKVSQNPDVPAGFTYLGQFIDHDLTFDPTPFDARRRDPHALVDFRTPRFDLDSVYGLGPDVQPYLYDRDGIRLLVGTAPDGTPDLPRNAQQVALTGDPRNDENQIVSQLHLLFLRFHNAAAAHLAAAEAGELFVRARESVRRHYEWVVAHDFLPKIVGEVMAKAVLAERKLFRPGRAPFIPVEFSGAAYRFGHSMVRDRYGLKRLPVDAPGTNPVLLKDLFGRKDLTTDHVIDWERFFDLGAPSRPQSSFSIDRAISPALFTLPDGEPVLARRNLVRGHKLGLPSGQDVADALGVPRLTPADLDIPPGTRHRDVLQRSTPLWYYVLAEAETQAGGRHLGPVGGRIVGEVIAGLLDLDPRWRPGELGTGPTFTMAQLIRFAQP